MGGKKPELWEKEFAVLHQEVKDLAGIISRFDERLKSVEDGVRDNLKMKRSTKIEIAIGCIGLISVIFYAGIVYNQHNIYIGKVDELSKRMTQIQLSNDTACIRLPQEAQIAMTTNSNTGDKELAPLTWKDTTVVDEDEDITAEDLIGKKIVATYEEEGIHTVFYGSYNQRYHWQGSCLLNSYNDDQQLVYVMEGLYEDGELLSYKQFSVEKDEKGEEYWLVTKRIAVEGGNQGESWTYYKEGNIKQTFEWGVVTPQDMFTIDDIMDRLSPLRRSYYKGMTADGQYNDKTGDSLLVLFDKEGEVNTLYQGQFVDGTMEDATGNAWEIARDPKQNIPYMYQQGVFEGGRCISTTVPTQTELTKNDIRYYLDEHGVENVWEWGD